MTNHPETKPDNRNNTPREARLRSHLRASGLLADRLRNHLCTLALLADLLRNHLCTLALLADLLLIVTWSALSKTSALRRPVSLVSFSMLYLLFAAAYEKAHTRSTLKQSLTDAIRTVLLPGVLAVFFANCRIFFSSEGQTPITFAKQMKTCATQLFWSLGSSQSGHPEMGVAWVLISLFWCVSLYAIVKAIFKTRRTAILRLAFAVLCAAAGYLLHKKNILLPLALDKSLLGFFLYTVGAEFSALIFTPNTSFTSSKILPSWLSGYAWITTDIFAHALDGMTDPWWNHGSGIIRILLRFTLMILSTDLLIYVIDSIKEMRATGIKPIALIFKSIVEVFKPLRKTASGISNNIASRSLTERPHPQGNYILTTISGLLSRRPKASLVVFYILFTYVYLIRTVETTMFTVMIADYKRYYNGLFKLSVFILLLYALKELYQSTTNKRFLAYICTLAIGFAHWRTGGSYNLFILCVLIVAMTNKSMKKVLTLSIITTVTVLLAAFWASQNGYIYNFIYPDGGHALGTVYKTDCMALWFYTLLKYAVVRGGAFAWFEYPLLLFVILYLFHLTRAVTSTICMISFLSICLILQMVKVFKATSLNSENTVFIDKSKGSWLTPILSLIYPLSAIITYISVFTLTNFAQEHSNGKLVSISQRLLLSKKAFDEYPLTLLGQLVQQQGAGGIIPSDSEYFFLDNAYVQLLIVWGVLLLILVLLYSTKITKQSISRSCKVLLFALICIAIHSFIEHHLSQYYYNTFLLTAFINWDNKTRDMILQSPEQQKIIIDLLLHS